MSGNEGGWIVERHEGVNMELRLGLKFAAAFTDNRHLPSKCELWLTWRKFAAPGLSQQPVARGKIVPKEMSRQGATSRRKRIGNTDFTFSVPGISAVKS
jgi:hypothetical protein